MAVRPHVGAPDDAQVRRALRPRHSVALHAASTTTERVSVRP